MSSAQPHPHVADIASTGDRRRCTPRSGIQIRDQIPTAERGERSQHQASQDANPEAMEVDL